MGGGVSVFNERCARAKSNDNICLHIDTYYESTVHTPAIFWKIPVEDIESFEKFKDLEIEETFSFKIGKNGEYDDCHRDIKGAIDDGVEDFAEKYCKPPNIFMCIGNQEYQIKQEEFDTLKSWATEKEYYTK